MATKEKNVLELTHTKTTQGIVCVTIFVGYAAVPWRHLAVDQTTTPNEPFSISFFFGLDLYKKKEVGDNNGKHNDAVITDLKKKRMYIYMRILSIAKGK